MEEVDMMAMEVSFEEFKNLMTKKGMSYHDE
jgi:hypothetical protein